MTVLSWNGSKLPGKNIYKIGPRSLSENEAPKGPLVGCKLTKKLKKEARNKRSSLVTERKVLWHWHTIYVKFFEPKIFQPGNTKGGKCHCTIDLQFDWFELVCFANKNKNCQLSYSSFQTSQRGGQRYSDTSTFSISCSNIRCCIDTKFSRQLNLLLGVIFGQN